MARIQDDHQCKLRRRFDTRQNAQAAALRIASNQGKQRMPEACRHCNGWHLSEPRK